VRSVGLGLGGFALARLRLRAVLVLSLFYLGVILLFGPKLLTYLVVLLNSLHFCNRVTDRGRLRGTFREIYFITFTREILALIRLDASLGYLFLFNVSQNFGL
jgi:hypothetical protein